MILNRNFALTTTLGLCLATTGVCAQASPHDDGLATALFERVHPLSTASAQSVLSSQDRIAIAALLPLRMRDGEVVDTTCRAPARADSFVVDLNDDKQSEVIVIAGNGCADGVTGSSIYVVIHQQGWRVALTASASDFRLLPTRGNSGWRDLLLMGRSACYGRFRYDAERRAYVAAGSMDEQGHSCK